MPRKPKNQQKEDLVGTSLRDNFQTPDYATELLVPFLQEILPMSFGIFRVWECASGLGKIAKYLKSREFTDFDVIETDLVSGFNFLTDIMSFPFDCIVTNPPFSIKRKFFWKCLDYQKPFALLIPADYSGWTIETVEKFGCEKVIPTRRIDYITPNILKRIHEGEIWNGIKNTYIDYDLEKFKEEKQDLWNRVLEMNEHFCNYESIYEAPKNLLRKYSSSYYHSMWLTWGFGIGKSETFVELTNSQKDNI